MSKSMRNVLILAAALVLPFCAACTSLAARDHARMLEIAQQDDQICTQQGWKYPEPRYVSCRMQLQDGRIYQDWMNLQQMHQTNYTPPYVPPAYPYRDSYRPLNPEHFSCSLVTEEKHDYILCSEDEHQSQDEQKSGA